jgi:hypothetical protein
MSVEASVYSSKGKHEDTLIEQVKADRSINPTNAHWEQAKDWQKTDLMLVPDEGKTIDDVLFSDQTPLWHTHGVMFDSIVGKDVHATHDELPDKTIMYFTKWNKD